MKYNLIVNNVKKGFKNFLLGAISFQLEQGKVLALVGPNGAGKTTTLDCISGLLYPDSGKIEVCGIETNPNDKSWKYNFGYVSSEPIFINSMNGEEFLKFVSHYYPKWNFETTLNLIEKLEFNTKERIDKLSTGNKTKLEIISAMSVQPKLLLLDEPTNALDPIIRDRFIDIIFDYMTNEENSVIWSTHIISEVSKIADEFAFLHNGLIYEISSKNDLTENWRRIIIKQDLKIENIPDVCEIQKIDNQFEIFTSNFQNTVEYLQKNNIEIINEYYMSIENICLKNLEKFKREEY